MKKQPEYQLQVQVCRYLMLQYKNVLFMSDTVAQVKLTIPQSMRNKAIQKPEFKCPDLIIFEPRNGYAGLFIELKAETPYKRNGELKSSEHLQGQDETMKKLKGKGYLCEFAWSFDIARKIIDEYLRQKTTTTA